MAAKTYGIRLKDEHPLRDYIESVSDEHHCAYSEIIAKSLHLAKESGLFDNVDLQRSKKRKKNNSASNVESTGSDNKEKSNGGVSAARVSQSKGKSGSETGADTPAEEDNGRTENEEAEEEEENEKEDDFFPF